MDYMEYLHKRTKVNFAIRTAIALLSIAILIGIEHNLTNASAQTEPMNNTLLVSGSATAHTKPDKVTISLGVETTNTTAQAALSSNSHLMNKALDALRAAGVQANETSTSSFTIIPNYNYSSNSNQGRLIGFTVSNSVQIESKNMGSVSKWIDTALSSGANNVNSISFDLSDKKLDEIKNSLLEDAVSNAKTKADIAATAAGLKVVGVKSISVDNFGLTPPPLTRNYISNSFATEAAPSSTPIFSGQQEVSASVSITYLLGS